MDKEIIKNSNGCEVTIAFKKISEDVKDKVLWLILASFKERMEEQLKVSVDQ